MALWPLTLKIRVRTSTLARPAEVRALSFAAMVALVRSISNALILRWVMMTHLKEAGSVTTAAQTKVKIFAIDLAEGSFICLRKG